MMFPHSMLEAAGMTCPPWFGVIRAGYDAAPSAESKRPSAVEPMSTDFMTFFTGDAAMRAQSPGLPKQDSMSSTVAANFRRWQVKPNTFNEMVSTTPLDRLIGRLRSYKLLGPNWNGYGGQPPSSGAVEDCIDFLRSLDASRVLPKPMVGGDGEVGVFWETDTIYIEVGFRGEGRLEYLISVDGKDVEGIGLLSQTVAELAEGLTHISCS